MTFSRYAIFATLPDGAASRFCTSLLGWDSATGQTVPHPKIDGLPAPITELTQTPRKYGLHGTIKPPFRLSQGATFEALHDAFEQLCAGLSPIHLDGLSLTRLGGFLALTAQGDTAALNHMAAKTVSALDPFRAPMDRAEKARRIRPNMSPQQRLNLERWGYPHVMDAFKFHMTLTGRMPRREADQTLTILKPMINPLLPSPFAFKSLTLMGEDASGLFHQLRHVSLGA